MIQVALHPEGVDRNDVLQVCKTVVYDVALHPEGVDRNNLALQDAETQAGRPPPGGRG